MKLLQNRPKKTKKNTRWRRTNRNNRHCRIRIEPTMARRRRIRRRRRGQQRRWGKEKENERINREMKRAYDVTITAWWTKCSVVRLFDDATNDGDENDDDSTNSTSSNSGDGRRRKERGNSTQQLFYTHFTIQKNETLNECAIKLKAHDDSRVEYYERWWYVWPMLLVAAVRGEC